MGKAKIIQHLGSGQYRVRLLYNDRRARDEIARLEKKIEKINSQLRDLADKIDTAEDNYAKAKDDYEQAIKNLTLDKDEPESQTTVHDPSSDTSEPLLTDPSDTSYQPPTYDPSGDQEDSTEDTSSEDTSDPWEAYKQAQKRMIQAIYKLMQHKRKRRIWKSERQAAYQRIDLIKRNLPSEPEIYAWCADLSTNLSGEVGTIELPGLEQENIQIRPGYQDGAAYDPERDGQVTPLISQTPAQAFYNFAVLPGIQKWWPRYRSGTIHDIDPDADTCRVELDRAESQAQGIEVNDKEELQDVPIEYMTCNATAFKEGNEVIVEFPERTWESAKVIGFLYEPQRCEFYLKLMINGYECTQPHSVGIYHHPLTGYLVEEKDHLPSDYLVILTVFETDSKGVAGPISEEIIRDSVLSTSIKNWIEEGTEGFKLSVMYPSLGARDLFLHYIKPEEAAEGHQLSYFTAPKLYAGFFYNYAPEQEEPPAYGIETGDTAFWYYTDDPEKMLDDHGWYSLEVMDEDEFLNTGYDKEKSNIQTVQALRVDWLHHTTSLADFEYATFEDEGGNQRSGIVVNFQGVRTVRLLKEIRYRPPAILWWDYDLALSGYFAFRERAGDVNIEFYDKHTLSDMYKLKFAQGTYIPDGEKGATKHFDFTKIESGPGTLDDVYQITFTSETDFVLTFKWRYLSFLGNKKEDFIIYDETTEALLLKIPYTAWTYDNWLKDDEIEFHVMLGAFDLYKEVSSDWEDELRWEKDPDNKEGGVTYLDFTRVYIDKLSGKMYNDWTLRAHGWRGTFREGDEITFEVRGITDGIEVCGHDPLGDTSIYTDTEYMHGLGGITDLKAPVIRQSFAGLGGHYGGGEKCPESFWPSVDEDATYRSDPDSDCEKGGLVDWEAIYNGAFFRQIQDYDRTIEAKDLVPITDPYGFFPKMGGLTIPIEMQNIAYQLYISHVRPDGDLCAHGIWHSKNNTDYMDFERYTLELVDIPRDWI